MKLLAAIPLIFGVPMCQSDDTDTRCRALIPAAIAAGFEPADLDTVIKIAYRESRCTWNAVSPTRDFGAMQINAKTWEETWEEMGLNRTTILDPYSNMMMAKYIADRADAYGCKWRPWYMSGDYCD
jgi:hypothetical protein